MDAKVFVVFAIMANYCFIEGCKTQSAADVKINVDTEGPISQFTDILKRMTKTLFSDSSDQVNNVYPSSVNSPYSFPIPSVYFSLSNPDTENYRYNAPSPQYTPISHYSGEARQATPSPLESIPHASQTPIIVQREPDSSLHVSTEIPQHPQLNYQTINTPISNPCLGRVCSNGGKCVIRRNPYNPQNPYIPVCVNPCETVRCSSGYTCRVEVGSCGTPFCEPKAFCRAPCDEIICAGNETCNIVSVCDSTNCEQVPICGQDPCETSVCPLGQGCFLKVKPCNSPPCPVEADCRDVCKGVICGRGEYCYSEDVQCIKAPCNPIPVCRNPCASLTCPVGQVCVHEKAFCIRTPCNPIAVCKPV